MDRAAGPKPAHAVCLADRVGGLASPADLVAACDSGAVNGGRQLGIGTGGCFAVWIVC